MCACITLYNTFLISVVSIKVDLNRHSFFFEHYTQYTLQRTGRCTGSPPTCDVVHYNSSSRVSNVTRDEATKSLLPCRVPQLQPDLWGRKGKRMGGEIKEEKTKKQNGRKQNKKNRGQKWGKLWWQKVNWKETKWGQTTGRRQREDRESIVHAGSEWPPERASCLGPLGEINNHPSLVINPPLLIK